MSDIAVLIAAAGIGWPLWRIANSLNILEDEIGRIRRIIGPGLIDADTDMGHLRLIWRMLERATTKN